MVIDGVANIRLLGGRVLILPDPRPEKHGLIIIPPSARGRRPEEQVAYGRVLALGPGMKILNHSKWKGGNDFRWPMPDGVKVGDRVLYRLWQAQRKIRIARLEIDGVIQEDVEVEIISDENIEGVFEESAA